MNDSPPSAAQGPLSGLRVVEFAGIGPAPFACMLLSDMGADVVTVERPGKKLGEPSNIIGRGRKVIIADLKDAAQRDGIRRLADCAGVLVEGFRPGVMERLGLGPEVLLARNPRLVYGRMTGWGQYGPLAQAAGHDLNYIAITGALDAIGPAGGPPLPPLNLVGDFGGGSLYLVMGLLAALYEARSSGRGQVVDAAVSDGAISLMTAVAGQAARGSYQERRASNLLDGGAPFYRAYRCADGQYVAVAAIEPRFFALLCEKTGLPEELRAAQQDRGAWPRMHAAFEAIFAAKPRAVWSALLEGTDACFGPVLPLSQAADHPHNRARGTFVEVAGVRQPAPAPRFSRSPSAVQGPAPARPATLDEVLARWNR